jgi:hypothetical protein
MTAAIQSKTRRRSKKDRNPVISSIGPRGCKVTVYDRDRSGMAYVRYAYAGQRHRRALDIYLRNADGQNNPKAHQAINAEQKRILDCILSGKDPFEAGTTTSGSETAWTLDRAFSEFLGPDGPATDLTEQHRRRYLQTQKELLAMFGPGKLATELRHAELQAYANRRRNAIAAGGKTTGARQAEIEVRCVLKVLKWLAYGHGVEGIRVTAHPELLETLQAVQTPKRPRYSDSEAATLARFLNRADPRFTLLLAVQDGQRAGQLLRSRRSELLRERDPELQRDILVLQVPGKRNKDPKEYVLSPAAAAAMTRALSDGHLRDLEKRYADSGADYFLFPGHLDRLPPDGVVPPRDLPPMSREFARDMLLELERIAGVKHVAGRCFHGFRRRIVDVVAENNGTLDEIKAAGNWDTGQMPSDVYRDRHQRLHRVRAAQKMSGRTVADFAASQRG